MGANHPTNFTAFISPLATYKEALTNLENTKQGLNFYREVP
jgi:hypothetical protein